MEIIAVVNISANGSANHNPLAPNNIGNNIKQGIENTNPLRIVNIVAFVAFSILCR